MNFIKSLAVAVLLSALPLAGATISVLYGDADGFGVGATTFKDPLVDSAGVGEAAGTDVRRIGAGFAAPAFAPTDTLLFGPPAGAITSVIVTMSMAEFGGNISPVDGPNSIMVDGTAVPDAFLDSFASFGGGADPNIETISFALPSSMFSLFSDGSIDLTGTRISERGGFGSFQVDYLQFDVTASDVPEPGTFGLLGLGGVAAGVLARRLRRTR